MTSHYRTQSLDRRDRSLVERDFANHFGNTLTSPALQQYNGRSTSNGKIDNIDDDVTTTAWRRTVEATGKGRVPILRKNGLTTSRTGELTLSSGSDTIQRMSRSRSRFNSESSSTIDPSSSTATETGVDGQRAILTVNTVSNVPAAAAASRSRTSSVSGENRTTALTGNKITTDRDFGSLETRRPRRTSSTSTEACRVFDEQLSEWTATLDKLSQLNTNVGKTETSTASVYPSLSGRRGVVDEPVIERQSARRHDWQSTMPSFMREPTRQASSFRPSTTTMNTPTATLNRSQRAGADSGLVSARSRISGERGYASDSEDSMDWLERQRNRLNSGHGGRRWVPPPRTDVERKLITELQASQDKLFGSQLDDLSTALDDNGNVQTDRKYFTLDSSRSARTRQHMKSFDDSQSTWLTNDYANGHVNGLVNGHGGSRGGGGCLERSSTLGRTPVTEERLTKTTIKKTSGGYDPRRLDTLDTNLQRSSTLPRRWQPVTRPPVASSSDRSDSGYNTEWSKHTFESSTSRNIADFNRDAMRTTMPRPAKLVVDEDEEIRLRPIGPGYQTLEHPSMTAQLKRQLITVQAAAANSSSSLTSSAAAAAAPVYRTRVPASFERKPLIHDTEPLVETELFIDENRLSTASTWYSTDESSAADDAQTTTTARSSASYSTVFGDNEHSDSSNSLPTTTTPGVQVKDQHQHPDRIVSSPAQDSQTLVDYASTWHRKQQHHGRSVPTTTSNETERQTGHTWSQTSTQHRLPVLPIQVASTPAASMVVQHPVKHQRGHRRTQSSSNVIDYRTTGNGYSAGVSLTSDGDYDRLDSRQSQHQHPQLQGQRQQQEQQFLLATSSSQPVQFHTLRHQFPVAVAAVQNPPLVSSVHRQQQQAPAAPIRNGHRRTQSTGLTEQFGDGPPGGWSPQQLNSTWNGGIIYYQNQATMKSPVGGVNGESFVPVQQKSVEASGVSSSVKNGLLPGHYSGRMQQQHPTVVPHNGHSFQQITVNNCYQPTTLLRPETGHDVIGAFRQNLLPSASPIEYRHVTYPEIVVHPPPQSTGTDFTKSQLTSVVYRDGTAHNGLSTVSDGSTFQQQPGVMSTQSTRDQQVQLHYQQQQQQQPTHGVVQHNTINGSTFQRQGVIRGMQQQQQQTPLSWQQQPQYQQPNRATSKSNDLQFNSARGTLEQTSSRDIVKSNQQSVAIVGQGSTAAVVSSPPRPVNGPTSTPSTWQHQQQQQQHQQNQLTADRSIEQPKDDTSSELGEVIAVWDQLMNQEIDNRLQSSPPKPGNGIAESRDRQAPPPVANGFASTPQRPQQQQRQQFDGTPAGGVTPSSFPRGVNVPPMGTTAVVHPPIAPEDYTIKRTPGSRSQWMRSPAETDGSLQRGSGTSTDTDSSISARQSSGDSFSIFGDNGIEPPDLQRLTMKFVKDSSGQWYRPGISREEAVAMLKGQPEGSFVVRNSNSFPGAFALAIKVSQLPTNFQSKGKSTGDDFVRNFLIETTAHGVRVKGNKNEPIFASLAALVYQHSVTPLSLPCKLLLPSVTGVSTRSVITKTEAENVSSHHHMLQHGAACLVVYINTVDVESLTGDEAIERAVTKTLDSIRSGDLTTTLAQFKVSAQGVTLTDNKHRIFFRRHYNMNTVIYAGVDRRNRKWTQNDVDSKGSLDSRVFGFVSRKPGTNGNECHVLADYEPEHPAIDVVDFLRKTMVGLKAT